MRVVILGGGIIGMFVSYHLLKAGFSVTIVDRHHVGCEASLYNAGLITPSFAPAPPIGMAKLLLASIKGAGPLYISPSEVLKNAGWFLTALRTSPTGFEKAVMELGMKSLELYNDFFREEGIEADLMKGVIGLYKNPEHARQTAQMLRGQFMDRHEVSELGFREFGGGVLFREELSINPAKLYNELRRRLYEMGARVILGKGARLQPARARISSALVDGEEITGDVYVVAAGSWSRELCKPLGYDPRILPARGLVMTFDSGGARVVGYPSLLEDYGVAAVQHDQSTVRVTGFFELVGFRRTFSESRKRWLLDVVSRHLIEHSRLRHVGEGVGYRPCTPDQLPVIGRVPGYENLYIASGHCRLGVTLAPVTGYMVKSMVGGEEPSGITPSYFDPSRFMGPASFER